MRAQLGRVIAARGSWVVCSLLLASALLSGCNGTDAGNTASTTGTASTADAAARTVAMPRGTGTAQPVDRSAAGGSADVSWTAPTTNTNGSALTNLAGFRIYYGTSPSALNQTVDVPSAGATDHVIQSLPQGKWYFAVAAYTNSGLQSSFSSVVSKTIS